MFIHALIRKKEIKWPSIELQREEQVILSCFTYIGTTKDNKVNCNSDRKLFYSMKQTSLIQGTVANSATTPTSAG